jgi:hypothetical protein
MRSWLLLKMKIMNKLKLWWFRCFSVIDITLARKLNLEFKENIYGDEINHLNCRSIWADKKGRTFRVRQLGDF